jgi:LPXTG-motif cell wall-anchored protein
VTTETPEPTTAPTATTPPEEPTNPPEQTESPTEPPAEPTDAPTDAPPAETPENSAPVTDATNTVYFAEPQDDGTYLIFDEYGLPLGIITLPEGKTLEEIDIFANLVPLKELAVENERASIPRTGDDAMTALLIFASASALAAAAVVLGKKSKQS